MRYAETWDWLSTSPMLGFTLTLAVYVGARWLFVRTGHHAVLQPVLVCIVVIGGFLLLAEVSYSDYFHGASAIHFWLGPATVALALPLHREWERVRRAALPILVGVGVGAVVSAFSAVLATRWLGGTEALQWTMAPKAATTPVSIAISEQIGGIPALTAVVTVIAGITGAVGGPALLSLVRVRDERARGLALGASSHGIGTARALHESRTEGAFSGLSMALSALATSVVVPLVVALM